MRERLRGKKKATGLYALARQTDTLSLFKAERWPKFDF